MLIKPLDYLEVSALGTRLSLLEHHRDPMAREQLFSGLQGLGLLSSEDRHHRDAFGQVSDYVKQQAHGWCGQLIARCQLRRRAAYLIVAVHVIG